ncbi:hypothetical protein Ae717Ps2_5799c [Pseudonocardia sp. Ae717_Ps2]|nr:hypothetical protein Ae717Ps2_5799c [Pseudonocardia sp. Ae717_Ps2]
MLGGAAGRERGAGPVEQLDLERGFSNLPFDQVRPFRGRRTGSAGRGLTCISGYPSCCRSGFGAALQTLRGQVGKASVSLFQPDRGPAAKRRQGPRRQRPDPR